MNKPIIFGKYGYNTLGVIHCMAEKECPFLLLLISHSRFNTMLLSRYVKDYKIVATEEEGIQYLMMHKEKWRDAVVIPTSDKVESLLDLNLDNLIDYYHFPHAVRPGAVNYLMNKDEQLRLAKAAGLHIPITIYYKKGNALPEGITYPCFPKQQKSIAGKKEVLRRCDNELELMQAIDAAQCTTDFLIQQYIDKEYDILLIGCRFPDGKTWIPGVCKKTRWNLKGGDGSYGLISTKVEDFFPQLEEVNAFLERINYYGPFSIEFGVISSIPYIYEINLRNDGTSHLFHKAGIYIPYIYYLANNRQLTSEDLSIKDISYSFVDEFSDFTNIFTDQLSMSNWFRNLIHAGTYKYFVRHDMIPFIAMAPRRIVATIYNMLKS